MIHPNSFFIDAVTIHADAYVGYPSVQASIIEAGDTGGIETAAMESIGSGETKLGKIATTRAVEEGLGPQIFRFL